MVWWHWAISEKTLLSMRWKSNKNTKSLFDGIVVRCRKEIAESGLSGGGLRWKRKKKRMKKKDVPSALMRCLQHGSCSLQKEERDRANKQWPPDSARLLLLPLPTWIKAEGGCRWSYTNTYGLCTYGPSFILSPGQDWSKYWLVFWISWQSL